MAEVTICVPAFRAERFIHHTLSSIRGQAFGDFEVDIGIEPVDADATLDACAPYLDDPRFRVHVNPTVLGYAGNVRALFKRVSSPLFVALPHDDCWHPSFLERARATLAERPDAVCAFPDVWCFAPDGLGAGVMRQPIDDSSPAARILSWLLDGGSGNIWHGLCRSMVLGREYPDNVYRGFAAECEWAAHLLASGPVLRVPQPLYYKRQPSPVIPSSVSADWVRSAESLPGALDHHRRQLLAAIPDELRDDERETLRLATEAVVLRRRMEFADGRWGLTDVQLEAAAGLLASANRLAPDVRSRLVATVRWALSCHQQSAGDMAAAEREARSGMDADPDDELLSVRLGWLLVARSALEDAVQVGLRASAAHPDDPHVRLLLRHVDAAFERRLRASGGAVPSALEDAPELDSRALESRLAEIQSHSDLLQAERTRVVAESRALAVRLRREQLRAATLASRWQPSRMHRALARHSRVLVHLGLPSPLFDADWYRRAYPGVPTGRSLRAWRHWQRIGWRAGYDPNPLFDTEWYLAMYPDVLEAGVDPLVHYVLWGWSEARARSPARSIRRHTVNATRMSVPVASNPCSTTGCMVPSRAGLSVLWKSDEGPADRPRSVGRGRRPRDACVDGHVDRTAA